MATLLDITSGTITVNNGDTVAAISGATSEIFDVGTVMHIVGLRPVFITAGATTSEVRLLRPWSQGSLTDEPFDAYNTVEGFVSAIRGARETADALGVLTDDVNGYLDSLDELLTSTSPTIDINGNDVVPWGYLKDKFETESSGLLSEFEDDLKRNRLLSLAGIVL